uniref:Uncharacterized protein n=1 Tax=Rhizophora mucronata TaxID=61149 RepID=A0A2P2JAK5_RHIMU
MFENNWHTNEDPKESKPNTNPPINNSITHGSPTYSIFINYYLPNKE